MAQNNQAGGTWPAQMYYNTPQPNRYKRVGKCQVQFRHNAMFMYQLRRLAQGQDLFRRFDEERPLYHLPSWLQSAKHLCYESSLVIGI